MGKPRRYVIVTLTYGKAPQIHTHGITLQVCDSYADDTHLAAVISSDAIYSSFQYAVRRGGVALNMQAAVLTNQPSVTTE